MMKRIGFFDLENHFAFYGAYHSNRINIAIHMMCVWPILFTALLLLYFTPSLFNLPPFELSLSGYKVVLLFNIGFLLTLIYSVFYVRFDPRAGSLAAFLCLICWVSSSFIASRLGFLLAYKVSLDVTFVSLFLFRKFDVGISSFFCKSDVLSTFFILNYGYMFACLLGYLWIEYRFCFCICNFVNCFCKTGILVWMFHGSRIGALCFI